MWMCEDDGSSDSVATARVKAAIAVRAAPDSWLVEQRFQAADGPRDVTQHRSEF
jgi:hypothetical protein